VTTFACFNSKAARQTGEKHCKGANVIMDHFLLTVKTIEVSMALHSFHYPTQEDPKPQLALSQATRMKGSSKHPYQINRLTIDLPPKTVAIS